MLRVLRNTFTIYSGKQHNDFFDKSFNTLLFYTPLPPKKNAFQSSSICEIIYYCMDWHWLRSAVYYCYEWIMVFILCFITCLKTDLCVNFSERKIDVYFVCLWSGAFSSIFFSFKKEQLSRKCRGTLIFRFIALSWIRKEI